MNELYKEILLNLMLIENEEHPLVRMITYAKIVGIIEYALVKEDIEEEKAKELANLLELLIHASANLIHKYTL